MYILTVLFLSATAMFPAVKYERHSPQACEAKMHVFAEIYRNLGYANKINSITGNNVTMVLSHPKSNSIVLSCDPQ